MNRILLITILLTLIISQGCIHTYPGENAEDPTRIQLALDLDFNLTTDHLNQMHAPTRAIQSSYKVSIEVHGSNSTSIRHDTIMEEIDQANDHLKITFPSPLKPEQYKVCVWCQPSDPYSHDLDFDVSTLSKVTAMRPLSSSSAADRSAYATATLDLTSHHDKLQSRHIQRMTLTSPFARIVLRATDIEEFLRYADKAIANGEHYTAGISFSSMMPSAFDVAAGKPCSHTSGQEEISALPPLFSSQINILSARVFASGLREDINATITIQNSALSIISRTRDIVIPIKAGCVTTVSGDFLTNFSSNIIDVDNEWGEKITVIIK